jgi:predicted nucleic acid-binding protein
MTYLVDTDWLIHVFNNQQSFVDELNQLAADGVAISIVSMAELYEGVHLASQPEAVRASIQRLQQQFPILGLDAETAEKFGEVRCHLRRVGQLIPDMDLLIASTALRHSLTLCTQNERHFQRIPDLSVLSLP